LKLTVDTHGHTDFAMALAKLLGFDLCPRLKALKDRHLFLPRGTPIPASVQEICRASVDLERISSHWEQIVHLVASVHCGHTSATHVTARFGSASRGTQQKQDALTGTADNGSGPVPVIGTLHDDQLAMTVSWASGGAGRYTATMSPSGQLIEGFTQNLSMPWSTATWNTVDQFECTKRSR
jgi:hypothetical protein